MTGTFLVRSSTVPGKTPKCGCVVIVPCSSTTMSRTSTLRVSPGDAPFMLIGPVAGLTWSHPTELNKSVSDCRALEKQSRVSTVIASPESTVSTGSWCSPMVSTVWLESRECIRVPPIAIDYERRLSLQPQSHVSKQNFLDMFVKIFEDIPYG